MSDLDPFFDSHEEEFPVNIKKIIRTVGLKLDENADLHEDIAGQIERIGRKRDFKISVADHLNENWKRYVMAHELGHYVLHESRIGEGVDDNKAFFSRPEGRFHNRNIRAQQETEAHIFAAKTLLPESRLSILMEEHEGKDETLADYIEEQSGVPAKVINWWIKKLHKMRHVDCE